MLFSLQIDEMLTIGFYGDLSEGCLDDLISKIV